MTESFIKTLWENLTWTDPRLSLTIIIISYYHAFHCRNTNVWLPWTSQQSRDFRENTVYVHHFLSYIRMSLNSENLLTPRVSLKGLSPHKLDICFIESLYLECSLPPICLENIQNISNVIMNEWIKEEINFFKNQELGASLRGWYKNLLTIRNLLMGESCLKFNFTHPIWVPFLLELGKHTDPKTCSWPATMETGSVKVTVKGDKNLTGPQQ